MVAPPAAAVAAFLRLLDRAAPGDAPAWAAAAGSALLFVAGLLGVHSPLRVPVVQVGRSGKGIRPGMGPRRSALGSPVHG